jgi:CBS-domain-containing membrane protein
MKRKLVEDLMSRSVIALREKEIVQIAKLDMDIAAIRHLPVVDDHQRVVGIVASSDLLQALARREGRPIPVTEVMTRDVRTVHRRMPAHEAVRIMLDHKIGSLPVLGDRERLEGMLTETDFLRVAEEALRGG